MRFRAILCVPLGHRWTTDSGSHGVDPQLICRRCGRQRANRAKAGDPKRAARAVDRGLIR